MPNLCIIPARALRSELSLVELRVLCAIGLHTDREGAGCWAKSRTLMDEAGVHRSQFYAATASLLAKGFIHRDGGELEGTSAVYTIILDEPRPRVDKSKVVHKGGPRSMDPPVHESWTPRSTNHGPPGPRNKDRTSLTPPSNAPSNAPKPAHAARAEGEGRKPKTAKARALHTISALRTTRIRHDTQGSGAVYSTDPGTIEGLDQIDREALQLIGGAQVIANAAEGTPLRVLRSQLATAYESLT